MALNMDTVFAKLAESTEQVELDITDKLETMDADNTADMLKMQQMMQQWTIAIQVQSNTTKTIGDGLKSVVSNMR
jgi:type III secretion protein F